MITPYGLVAILIGSVLLVVTAYELYKKKIRLVDFGIWSGLWILLILAGVFPELYTAIMRLLGITLPVHFITTYSIIVLFIMMYYVHVKLNELNVKIAKIAQNISLLEYRTRKRENRGEC